MYMMDKLTEFEAFYYAMYKRNFCMTNVVVEYVWTCIDLVISTEWRFPLKRCIEKVNLREKVAGSALA